MRSAWIIFAAALTVAACQPQRPTAPSKVETPAATLAAPPAPLPAATPQVDCPCANDTPTVQKASTRPRKARRVTRVSQPPVSEREYARPPADYSGPGYTERYTERTYDEANSAPAIASRDRYGFLNWPGKTPASP